MIFARKLAGNLFKTGYNKFSRNSSEGTYRPYKTKITSKHQHFKGLTPWLKMLQFCALKNKKTKFILEMVQLYFLSEIKRKDLIFKGFSKAKFEPRWYLRTSHFKGHLQTCQSLHQ